MTGSVSLPLNLDAPGVPPGLDEAMRIRSPGDALRLSAVPRWTRLLLAAASQIEIGGIRLNLPGGQTVYVAGVQDGPWGEVTFHNDRPARALLVRGDLAFAESFMDGDFDTPHLPDLLTVAAVNQAVFDRNMMDLKGWRKLLMRVLHRLRDNSRSGSRRNIAAHYDLGNEFYARWLDPSMTYSSALYVDPQDDLITAQGRKYDALARMAEIREGHRVLEIGAGWGGFAEFAAREIGCQVTGITISPAQHDFAARRIQEAGLNEKVEIRLCDYRDVEGRYDRVASIEMFEAVGEKYWPVYFQKLRERLVPGGIAGLQVITIAEEAFATYRRSTDFIQRYIFPGGMLPSPTALEAEVTSAGLRTVAWRAFGADYARTLAEWRESFLAVADEIAREGYDARFRRMWEYYLAYCEAGFRSDTIDVRQIAVART